MKTRRRELARAGIFGSRDNPTIVTEKDLQEIVETFPDIGTAPVKLGGHWTEDRPRLASVVSVEYVPETKTLMGSVEEQDALSAAVDEGYYPEVSIGAKSRASDGKMYLHHLAYLGDEPPAVRNLVRELEESLSDQSRDGRKKDVAASDAGRLFELPSTGERRLYLSDEPPAKKQEPAAAEAEKKEEVSMTEEEVAAMRAENERLKAEAAEKDKLLSDTANRQRQAEKEQLRKAAEGKVTVPQMEQLMELADSFEGGREIRLSDTEKAGPVTALARIFADLPLRVEPGELNLSDGGGGAKPAGTNLAAKMMAHV